MKRSGFFDSWRSTRCSGRRWSLNRLAINQPSLMQRRKWRPSLIALPRLPSRPPGRRPGHRATATAAATGTRRWPRPPAIYSRPAIKRAGRRGAGRHFHNPPTTEVNHGNFESYQCNRNPGSPSRGRAARGAGLDRPRGGAAALADGRSRRQYVHGACTRPRRARPRGTTSARPWTRCGSHSLRRLHQEQQGRPLAALVVFGPASPDRAMTFPLAWSSHRHFRR